jgi:hypothetical protein
VLLQELLGENARCVCFSSRLTQTEGTHVACCVLELPGRVLFIRFFDIEPTRLTFITLSAAFNIRGTSMEWLGFPRISRPHFDNTNTNASSTPGVDPRRYWVRTRLTRCQLRVPVSRAARCIPSSLALLCIPLLPGSNLETREMSSSAHATHISLTQHQHQQQHNQRYVKVPLQSTRVSRKLSVG